MGHLTGTARQTGTSNILRDAGGKLGGITHPSTSMCRRPVNLRSCFFVFFFVASILREQLIRGPSTPREVCARGPTSSAYAFFFVLSGALRFCASFFFGARVSPHLPHLSHVEGFFFVLRVTDLQACACCVILICVFRVLWSQVCVCVWKCGSVQQVLKSLVRSSTSVCLLDLEEN